ncbi:hypothetical protein EWI61_04305 [Methylolobus aquaticus]|nr:hypothetical protein EWI61_04305 [Methylolobus aquaticus]
MDKETGRTDPATFLDREDAIARAKNMVSLIAALLPDIDTYGDGPRAGIQAVCEHIEELLDGSPRPV